MGALLMEAARVNRRMSELIAFRLQHERVLQAQAQALEQAKQLSEAKSRFVATMSHEMRTPLHGMLGLVRMLRSRIQDAVDLHQLDLMRSTGEHLVSVINAVLDFSKMEAGRLPLHQADFAIEPLLKDLAETTQVVAQDKGLRLTVELDMAPSTQVRGDPVRIRQVLHNLLGNAIKFTPSGHVHLRAHWRPETGILTVAVMDTGVGIAAADQARIFDAFHQAEGTYQRRFGGTGLGLTISRELCRAMGGELSCQSTVGQGSTFTFSLPLSVPLSAPSTEAPTSNTKAAPPQPVATTSALASSCQVLLVEDNPVNALVAEAELARLGIEVTTVCSGTEALTQLSKHPYGLVLMDCEMPGMDGIEATRRIREMERRAGRTACRIVALTANGRDMYEERGIPAGMDDYLSKPFNSEELEQVIRRQQDLAPCMA
jgi:two-component system, sensor histidine kinase